MNELNNSTHCFSQINNKDTIVSASDIIFFTKRSRLTKQTNFLLSSSIQLFSCSHVIFLIVGNFLLIPYTVILIDMDKDGAGAAMMMTR